MRRHSPQSASWFRRSAVKLVSILAFLGISYWFLSAPITTLINVRPITTLDYDLVTFQKPLERHEDLDPPRSTPPILPKSRSDSYKNNKHSSPTLPKVEKGNTRPNKDNPTLLKAHAAQKEAELKSALKKQESTKSTATTDDWDAKPSWLPGTLLLLDDR